MALQHPVLLSTGEIPLNAQHLGAWWDQWVARGALCVNPERELQALENVMITLSTEAGWRAEVFCEVVRLDPGRALLRLLDAPPAHPQPPIAEKTAVTDLASLGIGPTVLTTKSAEAASWADLVGSDEDAVYEVPQLQPVALQPIAPTPRTSAEGAIDFPRRPTPAHIELTPLAAPVHIDGTVETEAATDHLHDAPTLDLAPALTLPSADPDAPIVEMTPPVVAQPQVIEATVDVDGTAARLEPTPYGDDDAPPVIVTPAPANIEARAIVVAVAAPEVGVDVAPVVVMADETPPPPALVVDGAPPVVVATPAPTAAVDAPPVIVTTPAPSVVEATPSAVATRTPPAAVVDAPPAVVATPAPTAAVVDTPPVVVATPAPPAAVVDVTPPLVVATPTPPAVVVDTPPVVVATPAPPAVVVDVTPPLVVATPTPPAVVVDTPPVVVATPAPPAVVVDVTPPVIAPTAVIEVAPAVVVAATPAPATSSVAAASQAVSALPPYFAGDCLRFSSRAHFEANRKNLIDIGALLVIFDGLPPAKAIEVRVAVGEREGKMRARATLAQAGVGTAVLQAESKGGFIPLVFEVDAPTSKSVSPVAVITQAAHTTQQQVRAASASATMMSAPPPWSEVRSDASSTSTVKVISASGEAAAARVFQMPKQGALFNPVTANGILSLAVMRNPNDADLNRPSVPLLLRWLRTTKGVQRVEFSADDQPLFTLAVVDGREVRTPAALNSLGKMLATPRLTYAIYDMGRVPDFTTKARTLHLIAEVVRCLTHGLETDALQAGFPNPPGKVLRAVSHVVESLGLPSHHTRFVKTDLGGDQFLEEIMRAAVGARTVWDTLYTLELFGGLAFEDPPDGKILKRSNTARMRAAAASSDDDVWLYFEGKDHFQVLGLHWSCSPSEVQPAYGKLRADYAPGGIKRPSNDVVAQRILDRLDEAQKVLLDPNARRTYRREKFNFVWSQQAQMLVGKAKMEIYRKNFVDAKNILDAAEDICPSEEAKAQFVALAIAIKKARGT